MALDDLGSLYLAMGHADLAVRIKEKTLQLYKKIDDHEGSAVACSDLAGLALSQPRIRNGRKYLELAKREQKLGKCPGWRQSRRNIFYARLARATAG
jgi:hypothetical protein